MSQILILTLAKPRPQRFFLASLAYMDVGQGRKQDAEALRLCERKYSLSCLVSLRLGLARRLNEISL